MPRKKIEIEKGDIFSIPLVDGTYAFGQIIFPPGPKAMGAVACILFACHSDSNEKIPYDDLNASSLISAVLVTPDLLRSGRWKIIDRTTELLVQETTLPFQAMRQANFIMAKIRGSGLVEGFLNALFALRPWDDYHDPLYFDGYLLYPDKKPKNLIFKKA